MASISSSRVVAVVVLIVNVSLIALSEDQQCSDHDLGPSFILGHSCTDIYQQNEQAHNISGYYWILDGNSIRQQYCHMERLKQCGSSAPWTKIASIVITEESSVEDCRKLTDIDVKPKINHTANQDAYACQIKANTNCTSVTFPTNNTNYTEICGQVIAYTNRNMDAFKGSTASIEDHFVDGISVLVKSSPMTHIWTYAIGQRNRSREGGNCPGRRPSTNQPPNFVGNNYYCDDDYRSLKSEQPLWSNSQACTHNNSRCSDNRPWFHYEIADSLNDDVVVKICSKTKKKKRIFINTLELYIT